MRAAMEKMEEERAQLVEEVEAQIERALKSMSMSIEMSDSEGSNYDDEADVDADGNTASSSRPVSRLSDMPQSRPVTRAMSTDSATLAGTAENDDIIRHSIESSAIAEEIEDEGSASGASPPTEREQPQQRIDASNAPAGERDEDAMGAVDEGIHTNSDKIAQKVLQIQQKLENALSQPQQHPRRGGPNWRPSLESETDGSDRDASRARTSRPISPLIRPNASLEAMSSRTRSNTMSSSQTLTRANKAKAAKREKEKAAASANSPTKPTVQTNTVQSPEEPMPSLSPSTTVTLSPTTSTNPPLTPSVTTVAPIATASTEDSDTDFQSAYSTSPRQSYHESEESGLDATPNRKTTHQIASKRDTVIAAPNGAQIHHKLTNGAISGKTTSTA